MLLTGQEYLESIRDGRRVYVGSERVDDVTTHPAFRNAARSFAMIYDRKRAPENRDGDDLRGGRRDLLELFPAAAHARRLAEALRDAPAHRVVDARAAGPLARQLSELCQRARHGPGDVRPHPAGLRRQHPELLPAHAVERHLRLAHRHQSAGLAAGRSEGRRAAHAADLARGGRGRPRRHHQRPEDARHRDGVLSRDLVRQSSAGGAGPGERIDHLRGAAQRAGRQHLVAQALREIRGERVRQSARLALRRERCRGAVRERARCRGSGCSATTTSR